MMISKFLCLKKIDHEFFICLIGLSYVISLIFAAVYLFPLCFKCNFVIFLMIFWVLTWAVIMFTGRFIFRLIEKNSLRLIKLMIRQYYVLYFSVGIFILLAYLFWLCSLFTYSVFFTSASSYISGKLTIEGIDGPIKITQDLQMVHIQASSVLDIMFANGFSHAQNRLFQMEVQRQFAKSNLKAIFGSDNDALNLDFYSSTLNFYDSSKLSINKISKKTIGFLESYCNGVNRFIKKYKKGALEFQYFKYWPDPDWSPVDVVALLKLVAHQYSANLKMELMRLNSKHNLKKEPKRVLQFTPEYPINGPTIVNDKNKPKESQNLNSRERVNNMVNDNSFYSKKSQFETTGSHTESIHDYDDENEEIPVDHNNGYTFNGQEFQEFHSRYPFMAASENLQNSPNNGNTGRRKIDNEDGSKDQEKKITHIRAINEMKKLEAFLKTSKKPEPSVFQNNIISNINDLYRIHSIFPLGVGRTGNAFAISGKYTKSASAYLANDIHLQISQPSALFPIHLSGPSIEATGAGIPGIPGILSGYSQYMSWGFTPTDVDQQDLFVLEIDENNDYIVNGTTKKFNTQTIDNNIVYRSDFGPILNNFIGFDFPYPIALKSMSLSEDDTTIEALIELIFAQDRNDLVNAISKWITPAINIVYADVNDNIGYELAGSVPIRNNYTGAYPVLGNGTYYWTEDKSKIINSKLSLFNPKTGLIIASDNKISPPDYEYLLVNDFDWGNVYRAERMIDLLNEINKPYSLEDILKIQQDEHSLMIRDFQYLFRKVSFDKKAYEEIANVLYAYDDEMKPDDVIPFIYQIWWRELTSKMKNETGMNNFDNPRFYLNLFKNITFPDPICKEYAFNCININKVVLETAIESQKIKSHFSNKIYGKYHQMHMKHIVFSKSTLGCFWDHKKWWGGDKYTISMGGYEFKTLEMNQASVFRFYVDMADLDHGKFLLAGGLSENLRDISYSLLYKKWIRGKYSQLCLTSCSIVDVDKREYIIEPS